MPSITLEDAQAPLAAWIAQLRPGEELVIVEKNRPVARLTAEPATSEEPRRPGSAKGILTIHEDDVGEALTAQMESAMQAGWSDSLMDEYNDYDSHRGQA